MKKPRKVAASYVCSACGESWDDHLKHLETKDRKAYEVTQEDCIRVLKAKKPVWSPVVLSGSSVTGGSTASAIAT